MGVKQVGQRPSVRTGVSTAVGRDRAYMMEWPTRSRRATVMSSSS